MIRVYGTTAVQIKARNFNVFVGISIGNKFLDSDLAREYIKWALENSKAKPVILIADKIAAVNYEVLHGFDQKRATKKVTNKGGNFEKLFQRVIKRLASKVSELERIKILKWDDVINERYGELYKVLVKEFKDNSSFKDDVLFFVHEYLKHSRNRKALREEDLDRLADYILSELPILLEGIEVESLNYNLLFYPTYRESGMSKFVLDLHRGKYARLTETLDPERKIAMVESYIDS